MRLEVVTPVAIVVEEDDVRSVGAEDASGRFGILPGHADLITVLAISVLSWRRADGREGHCAVRGGLLTVRGGEQVAVATQEAVVATELETLEAVVLERLRAAEETVRDARIHARRMHVAALDHLLSYARRGGRGAWPGRLATRSENTDDRP